MATGGRAVVSQLGSREHYLLAKVFAEQQLLHTLVTDWYCPKWLAWLGKYENVPVSLRKLAQSRADDLRGEMIRSFPLLGVKRRLTRPHPSQRYEHLIHYNREFATRAASISWEGVSDFVGYSYASLETQRVAASRGIKCHLCQIDPGPKEWEIVQQERERWPEYEPPLPENAKPYFTRAIHEWRQADTIIVNSEWSYRCVVERGAPPEKTVVIPLGLDVPSERNARPNPHSDRVLRVLWLGTVCVRKGIQYLLEAARRFDASQLQVRIVGNSQINEAKVVDDGVVHWLGVIPRHEVTQQYAWADIMVIPTVSDGFAITQIEALSQGIPVIATPYCGAVVIPDKTGYIVEPSVDALTEIIERCISEKSHLGDMRADCLRRAREFSVERYSTSILSTVYSNSRLKT